MARPELLSDRTLKLVNGREVELPSGLLSLAVDDECYTTVYPDPSGKIRTSVYSNRDGLLQWLSVTDSQEPIIVHQDQMQVDLPHGTVSLDHPVGSVLAIGSCFVFAYTKAYREQNDIICTEATGAELWRRRGNYSGIGIGSNDLVVLGFQTYITEEIDMRTGSVLSTHHSK